MANYDEVVKRNKDYLTQAQINALAAASKEYNIANAGNRAGALASAREQYDTAYRGLQNMGLAGNPNAAPASGEVPRLQMQVKTPFDSYNERLKQVENQRLGALGEQFKQETIAERERAAAAAAAEAERRRQQEAYQRAVAAAQSMLSNIKTSITPSYVGPTLTDAEKAARKAQADGLKRTQQVKQQAFENGIGSLLSPVEKAQRDGMLRTARPQDVAAAALYNVAHYTPAPVVEAANAYQDRGVKLTESYNGKKSDADANRFFIGPNKTTFSKEQASAEYKDAQQAYDNLRWKQHYGGKVSEEEMTAAKETAEMAKLKAEKPETYSALSVYYDPTYKGTKEYDNAVNVIATEEAKALIKGVYGRDIDTNMTFDEYETHGKNIKAVKDLVAKLDYAEKTLDVAKKNKLLPATIAEDQKLVDDTIAELEKLGYTPEQARALPQNYEQERDVRAELEYYKNALAADMKYDGMKPTKGVNQNETDVTYRAVNNLPDIMRGQSRFVDFLPGGMSKSAFTDQDISAGSVYGKYMTPAEKNAYNYLYETQGLKAANAYLDAIRPLTNIEHARQDAAYAKELANDTVAMTVLNNLASVPVRAAGSIPAVIEKFAVGGLNALKDQFTGGAGPKYYIDTNSPGHQMANFASSIRSETSQRILDANKDNPTLANWSNRAYQIGMSTADSAFNMAFGIAGPTWLTGLLAGSDAANEAYKDARARGGTQEQALTLSALNGIAENLFETVSLEFFTNQWIEKGAAWTKPFVTKLLLGMGVEGSEEVNTSIANLLSDVYVMHDKSEWKRLIQEKGMKQAFFDTAKDIGFEGLAGAISGGIFGLFGGAFNGVRSYAETTSVGRQAQSLGLVQKYEDMATVLGGKAQKAAAKVESKETAHNVGKMVTQVNQQLSQAFTGKEQTDIPMALLFSGKQLSFTEANDVYQALGTETLEKMGYKADSAKSFMASYNDRMVESGIYARTQERLKESQANMANVQAEEYLGMTDQLAGTEYNEKNVAQNKAMREALEKRVWKNPNVGTAVTDDGTEVPALPGNMTRVGWAEMNRKNFKAQSTVTKGRTTYELSSMAMREGMTNEESYAAMRENMQEGAKKSADFYEKLSESLGLDIVVHDVMRGSNGFLKDGKLHVVLSSRQNAVRIASHELTHYMKAHSPEKFKILQDNLIREVGQKEFDRMVANKAAFYGFDANSKSGLANAREEVCAELCERMLSNDQMLARFAQRETATARAMKSHLEQTVEAIRNALTGNEGRDFGQSDSKMIKAVETMDSWIDGLTDAIANAEAQKRTMEGNIALTAGVTVEDQNALVEQLSEAKTDEDLDDAYTEFSVDVIEYDMAGYMQDLADAGVMTADEINDLYDTMTAAIDMVKSHRAILDYGTELTTEEEIQKAKRERAYMPYKQNADPHYKLALDFSTLCRKRVLLQTIQERLQAQMGRALTQEETVAIRLELQKLQREGYKVEVACALCYVEAARLKSPKVINTFLNNTGAEMRNYFAKKNPASKQIIEGLQQQWKVERGLAPDATKDDMKAAGVNVTDYNNYSREKREQLESDNAAEKVTIDRAVRLSNNEKVMIGGIEFPGRETFLSASWLTKLKSVDPDIFNAFTDKVRSATRSKAQETDTFYSRGDIDMVTESILNYANAESGFRHQSWSDFVPTHLLDTMAAVIEMSTRKAKMHAYTKVPSMVRLLGKTGMALNMSLIPAGDTGLVDGNLSFDSVEGMPWEVMMELRDMFPDTAGNIAIGINGEQIQKLLSSNDIDYVIPYHASGMNKNMRGYLDIRAWSEYTSSQNEKTNHRGTKGAAPELAEWFDEKAAAKAEDGYAFMRAASEKYLQLCYERNLTPKFSQYLTNNGDGSYSLKEGYENYWKMLTDRKMVNQKTGKVIIQEAVKPIFDKDTALGILEDRLADPAIQDAAKAADIVTEKFSGWQANRNNADAEAIQESKNIRDRTAAITAQKTAEAMHSVDELEAAEENLKYSLADEDTAKALDNDEMVKVYRAMQVIDGKLYPPMAAKVAEETGGKRQLVEPTEIGRWYVSDERPDLIDPKTGKWKLDKANGKTIEAAYNPYFHTSLSALNDQFSSAYDRPNLVVVEGYVPKSELTSGYKAQYAKDSVGAMRWHSGPVSSHLSTPRTVILSRYFKAGRILSDAEVAQQVANLVKGENVSIPQNTVTPGLYAELQKLGVPTTAMYSIDDEYMDLAEKYKAGTATETEADQLRQEVKRAATEAGYTIHAYHATDAEFTVYDRSKLGANTEGNALDASWEATAKIGHWFNTQDLRNRLAWLTKANESFLRIEKPLTFRSLQSLANRIEQVYGTRNITDGTSSTDLADRFVQYMTEKGYDGLVVRDEEFGGRSYVILNSNQAKSADPVTYDGDGNIIPLSKRFNANEQDTRYSLDEESPTQYTPEAVEQIAGFAEFLEKISGGDAQLYQKLVSALTPIINEKVTAAEKQATKTVQTAQKQKGMKPAGKQPRVRDVNVPQYAKTGNPVSDFVRSFLESDKATDEMVADLQDKIANGEWGSYTRLTNVEAMNAARDFIANRTLTKAQEEFHDMVKSGRYNVQTRAIGLQLLAEAAQRGDSEQVLNIATDLRELATDAGQSVQIFSALKELGGVGSAWYMQKKIDALNAKYQDKISAGKMNKITIDADLMQDLIEAKTTAEIEAAEDEIAKAIAKQLPLTWESRISNWRYLAMLANPTTHFRNLTGNFFMEHMNKTKDAVAAGIERLAVRDISKRAHAVLTLNDKKTWGDYAERNYNDQEKVLRGNGKFGFETQLRQYMRAFDTKWLNKIAQFNFDALENEDMWFIKPAYKNALMQYLKAQKYTLQDGVAGKIVNGEFKAMTKEQLNAAQEWAAQQAWKATFHDASTLATMLNNASKKLGPVGNVLIEGVMPFKKTPINIAKRGLEYSPAGIVMGAVQLAKDVKTGKVTTAAAIDNIASGITGSTLMAVGAILAKMGLLRSGGEDKKKHETYLSDTGDQTYALKIGGVSIGLSALAPATIPLFMGAALYDALDKHGEGLDLSALTETAANTLNPFMEMSFMSSLNSALKSYSNDGIGGALGNTLLTAAESYGSQFLPTVVAKAGQVFDPINRTTKSSAASSVGSGLDYYARSLAKKVPGLEATLQPDVDVWGRTTNTMDSFGKWALDFANKFIFPANVKVASKTAIDDELIRVVESTGNVDILPSDGPKYFTVKGEKYPMTAAQYTEYSIDRGQASYVALKETMMSDAYKSSTDEARADMLKNALSAAQKQVNDVWKEKLGAVEPVTAEPVKEQTEVKSTQGDYSDPALYKVAASYPKAYDKAAKAKAKGISPDTFLDLYEKKDTYSGDDLTKYTRQEIMKSNLSVKQKEFMDDLIVSDKGYNPDYSSQAWFDVSMLGKSKYDEAKMGAQVGLKPETYYKVYTKWKTLNAKDANGKTVNGLKKKRAKEYIDSLTLSGPEYSFIWTVMFGY